MSSCRIYGKDPIKISEAMVRACEDFNGAVEREILELKSKGLTGVIISTMWISVFRDPTTIPTSFVVDTSPEYYAVAETTLKRVIDRLDAAGLRVLVVGPFHMMPQEIPQCLARHEDAVCAADRQFIERQRKPSLEVLQRIVAGHDPSRVRLWDPLESVCDERICPAVRDGAVLYTDALHLTATGARGLLPDVRTQLDWVTGAE
jgi:hypothetical protein